MALENRNPKRHTVTISVIVISATIALLLASTIFYAVLPTVIKFLIFQETRLLNGSDTWVKWTNVTYPILIKFHIFNVTNPDESEWGGKFKVEDVGPYVWEEKRTKEIIEINENEDTITYKEIVHYYFREDLSVGSQDDTVSIVNLPFIMVATLAHKILSSTFADLLVEMFVSENEKFVLPDLKVRELVFDGVKLPDLYLTLASFGIADLPEEFVDGAFAFYNQKNGTPSKEFKVKSGIKNPNDFGKIVSFDGRKELDWWTNASRPSDEQYCNRINGTDGSIFAPFVSKEQKLEVFCYELCRSIYGIFERETDFQGIPAYVFVTPDRALNISLSNADTDCFCTDPGHGLTNSCDVAGFMRMFSCKAGTPVVLSLPHFLSGDETFLKEVEGMYPDKSKHETVIIVEPNSGAVLQAVKRIQINVEFQKLPGITQFSNITEAFIPVFWAEERANAPEEDLSYIRHMLVTPLKIINILKPSVFGIIAVALISGIVTVSFCKKERELLL